MARKKIKFGKTMSFYLSNEAIEKLNGLRLFYRALKNTPIVEMLILEKWEETKKKADSSGTQ
jgi:hypothetical protein